MATDTGVSIQSSIKLSKIALTLNLARVFAYLPPFTFQILDFTYKTVLIFIFDGVTVKTSDKSRWLNAEKMLKMMTIFGFFS